MAYMTGIKVARATSQQSHILSPGAIAGVTVGVIVAGIVAFFLVGSLINYYHVQKRAKRNERIEAHHRRWPSLESRYPTMAAAMSGGQYYVPANEKNAGMPVNQHYIPNVDRNAAMAHLQTQNTGAATPPDAEKIGVAVSPDVGTMDSPESYHSETSVSNLLSSRYSKALPPPPSSAAPARQESTCTIFEEFRQSHISAVYQPPVMPAAYTGAATPARSSSLRPRQSPPRLNIPDDRPSPVPIVVHPPGKIVPLRVANLRPNGPSRNDSGEGSSRSTSSSPPPSYAAFPQPPASKSTATQGAGARAAQLETPTRSRIRKDTPSYLPAYYTNPTPPAPVAPRMANPADFSSYALTRTNGGTTTPSTTAAGPELDPSSASSNGSGTSFESVLSRDVTPPEHQSQYTIPIQTDPESPLKDFRYPKIPRPSNQSIPRTPPLGSVSNKSRHMSNASSEMSKHGSHASLLEKRRGQETATKLEKKLWITESNTRRPPAAIPSQSQPQWPQRKSSQNQRPSGTSVQGQEQGPRWESKLTPRMKNGDMILEISSP